MSEEAPPPSKDSDYEVAVQPRAHARSVSSCRFSPDGNLLATACEFEAFILFLS